MDTIGARVREQRKLRGMTLLQLAKQAGLSQSYLSQLENGVIERPSGASLSALAGVLEVSMAYLLLHTDNPVPGIDPDANLTLEERLKKLGAVLRGSGANEVDVETVLNLLKARRQAKEAEAKLRRLNTQKPIK